MDMDSSGENKNWCKMQNKIAKFDFTWTIEKFSFCAQELGKFMRSSTFRDDERHNNWCLDLYPKGDREATKDYLTLYLRLLPNQKTTSVSAKFKFCLLKANGEHANVKGPEEAHKFGPDWSWGIGDFIRRKFLMNPKNGLLPDDRLSIFCEVSMVVDTVVSSQSDSPSIPQFHLSADMSAMLEKGLLTDCVLCSGDGREFQAHKAVLACRSPVFAAMFTNDTEEKQTGRVNIQDVSAPVMAQLLHFIYTGEAPKLLAEEGMAEELLLAADKYQLDRLRAMCEQQLSKGVNKENVCAMLVQADRHNIVRLKSRAMEYIAVHTDEVMETEGWSTLATSHPELLKQLVRGLRKRGGTESGGADREPKKRKQQ